MINTFDSKLGQSVKLTELYDYLGLTPTYYSRWIEKEIINNPYLIENKDYCTPVQVLKTAGRFRKEFDIHIDAAKKLCMVSKSAKGNEIRDELVRLTKKVDNLDYLNHDQIVYLSVLKTFFKFVDEQKKILKEHTEKFVSEHKNSFSNQYAEFNNWRNKMLNIAPEYLDEKIKQYCIENQKRMPVLKSKSEKIQFIDQYDSLKNAVWDFLSIKGEVNALKLAELCKRIAKAENLTILQHNEDNLFQQKENIINPKQLK